MTSKTMSKPPRINILWQKTAYLLDKFGKESINKEDKTIWLREVKIAKQLLELFPDLNFWEQIHLDFKLNSLAWFLRRENKAFLLTEWNKRNLITLPN